MMTGWPSDFSMPPCAIRTAVSAGPPGGNGTTVLIGFDGNAWAKAPRGSASAERTAAEWMRTERRVVILMASFDRLVGGEQKFRRDFEAQYLGRLEIDDGLE